MRNISLPVLALLSAAICLPAAARTYTGSQQDAIDRPNIPGNYNNVAFQPHSFNYTKEYLDANYSYSYVNENGVTVTVPISTPATTREAMKALLKEVFTNKDFPGRKWVFRDVQRDDQLRILDLDGNPLEINGNTFTDQAEAIDAVLKAGFSVEEKIDFRNDYVDYVFRPEDAAVREFGLIPGFDYSPTYEGETCLIVEGVDDNNPLDPTSDYYDRLKCITLMTSSFPMADNFNSYAKQNPGYGFNIEKPLHKFFLISKGKAREVDYQPMFGLFEEYSANEKSATVTGGVSNVYDALKDGEGFDVYHDCSTVVGNVGHYMVMGTIEDSAPADISLSIFIPFYRSYDDTRNGKTGEKYTWYDPAYRPFLYYYTIDLEAEMHPIVGEDGSTVSSDECEVELLWYTSFRKNIYNTPIDGEFWAYKVVGNVVDYSHPIHFSKVCQEPSMLTQLPNPDYTEESSLSPFIDIPEALQYEQRTLLDSDDTSRVLSNFDDAPVRVSYREEIRDEGRYETYVVTGRPEGYAKQPTQSNIVRVYIPSRDEIEARNFELAVETIGTSTFSPARLANSYENAVYLNNRSGSLAITGNEINIGDKFEIWREDINAGVAATPKLVATLEVSHYSNFVELPGKVNIVDGILYLDKYIAVNLYDAAGKLVDSEIRWKTTASRPASEPDPNYSGHYDYTPLAWHRAAENGEILSGMDFPAGSNHLAVVNDQLRASTFDNSHPDAYRYQMIHLSGDRRTPGNKAEIEVFKAEANVVPAVYSFKQVIADELSTEENAHARDIVLNLSTDPEIAYYRVMLKDDNSTVAIVQNNFGRISSSVAYTLEDGVRSYLPVGDVIDSRAHDRVSFHLSLADLDPALAARITAGENLYVVSLTERAVRPGLPADDASNPYARYNSYGSPKAFFSGAPELNLTSQGIFIFKDKDETISSNYLALLNGETQMPDYSERTFDALGVNHYTIWRRDPSAAINSDGDNSDGEWVQVINHANYSHPFPALPYLTDSFLSVEGGDYLTVVYEDPETHNSMLFGEGFNSLTKQAKYRVRAYIAVVPVVGYPSAPFSGSGPSFSNTPSTFDYESIGYVAAQADITALYSGQIHTGIDGIIDESENSDTTPVYYDLQGVKVDSLTPGKLYIEVKGSKSRKFIAD